MFGLVCLGVSSITQNLFGQVAIISFSFLIINKLDFFIYLFFLYFAYLDKYQIEIKNIKVNIYPTIILFSFFCCSFGILYKFLYTAKNVCCFIHNSQFKQPVLSFGLLDLFVCYG